MKLIMLSISMMLLAVIIPKKEPENKIQSPIVVPVSVNIKQYKNSENYSHKPFHNGLNLLYTNYQSRLNQTGC